jgi:predicted phosphodiesterase
MPNHRIAVLADIHGNLLALQAVLADARAQGADHFIVAGDILARAPYPLQTLRALQALGADLILGNADQYQIDYAHDLRPLGQQHSSHLYDVIAWTHAALGAQELAQVEALPAERVLELPGLPAVRVVHAEPGSLSGGLVPLRDRPALQAFRASSSWPTDRDPLPMAQQVGELAETLLICGHTHIAFDEPIDGRARVINPGSVGFSVEGDPRARYMLLEWREGTSQVERRAVPYDLARLRADFHASGLLAGGGAFARSCLAVSLTGQNASLLFVHALRRMEEQLSDPEEAWQRVEAEFDWQKYGV